MDNKSKTTELCLAPHLNAYVMTLCKQQSVMQAYFIKRFAYQALQLILRSKSTNGTRQKYFLSFVFFYILIIFTAKAKCYSI